MNMKFISVLIVLALVISTATAGGKSCKCVDKYHRCNDNWCNVNCNIVGHFCPPSYCRCVATPNPPPPPAPYDPHHTDKMCVKVPNGTHYDNVTHDILNGVCCAQSCGTCGGPECGSREGGRENCCVSVISPENKNCNGNLPPCVFAMGELPNATRVD